jgi:hypothetical protein
MYGHLSSLLVCLLMVSCKADAYQTPARPPAPALDTSPAAQAAPPAGPRIVLVYDPEDSKRTGEYQEFFAFYNSKGEIVQKLYNRRLPDRSPFRRITLPVYKEVSFENTSKVELTSVQDSGLVLGYFDLKGASPAVRKQNCHLLDPQAPDSIIRKTSKIFFTGRSQASYSDKMLCIGSYFS